MKTILTFIISLYQRTLSPDHGIFKFRYPYGYCRFFPTCSQYAMEAIKMHGTLKGTHLASRRLLSCNPWNQGGINHVPHGHDILKHK